MNPRQRDDELIVEQTGREVLLYDLRTDAAHHLDADASLVWNACDGNRTVEDLVTVTGLAPEAVEAALEQFVAIDVLRDVRGHTRRETLKRGLVGASAVVALPVVKSIVAPEAAVANTCLTTGTACGTSSQCCSGLCNGGVCA